MKELKEELGKDTKASWELYTKQTNKLSWLNNAGTKTTSQAAKPQG